MLFSIWSGRRNAGSLTKFWCRWFRFDAADKEEDFDEAVKKVKGDK